MSIYIISVSKTYTTFSERGEFLNTSYVLLGRVETHFLRVHCVYMGNEEDAIFLSCRGQVLALCCRVTCHLSVSANSGEVIR